VESSQEEKNFIHFALAKTDISALLPCKLALLPYTSGLQDAQADIAAITSEGLAFIATPVTIATPATSIDLSGSQPVP
jgi:hypothetical protein